MLQTIGEYHVAEGINKFKHGSLVMRGADSELGKVPTVLFGTVGGMLGVIASLPKKLFTHLENVQDAMRKVNYLFASENLLVKKKPLHWTTGIEPHWLIKVPCSIRSSRVLEVFPTRNSGGSLMKDEMLRPTTS